MLGLLAGSALADVELQLKDGKILRGIDVNREGDQYILEISEDSMMFGGA